MANEAVIQAFVSEMENALSENVASRRQPPTERRLLRSVTSECKTRATRAFLKQLAEALQANGVHTKPRLDHPGNALDDWVLFSTSPFPPDELLFPRERDLQEFVKSCIGVGTFDNLRPYREGRVDKSEQYVLPDGCRVDLLCEERDRDGRGALVAIELKRDDDRGAGVQIRHYLDQLRKRFPDRAVRGIVITGHLTDDLVAMQGGMDGDAIEWYRYEVRFQRM